MFEKLRKSLGLGPSSREKFRTSIQNSFNSLADTLAKAAKQDPSLAPGIRRVADAAKAALPPKQA